MQKLQKTAWKRQSFYTIVILMRYSKWSTVESENKTVTKCNLAKWHSFSLLFFYKAFDDKWWCFVLSLVCFGVDLWLCINVNIYLVYSYGIIYRVFVSHPSYFKQGGHHNQIKVWCGSAVAWLMFTFTRRLNFEFLRFFKALIAVWDPPPLERSPLLPLKGKSGATTKANATQCINILNEVFLIDVAYRIPTDENN